MLGYVSDLLEEFTDVQTWFYAYLHGTLLSGEKIQALGRCPSWKLVTASLQLARTV